MRISFIFSFSVAVLCLAPFAANAAWEQTAGPLGGTVNRIIVIDGTPWASLYSGGVYRLDENRWTQIGINNGLPENRSYDMVVDPTDSTVVHSAQVIGCGSSTHDAGTTWTGWCDELLPDIDADNYSSETIALDPEDSHTIYIAGHAHDNTTTFLKSADGGTTWEVVYTFSELMNFNHMVWFGDLLLLGTRSNGIFVSDDQGATWSELNTGIEETGMIRFAVDDENNRLFVATGLMQFNVRAGGSLYQLSDDRTQWDLVNGPTSVTGVAAEGGTVWAGTETGQVWKENSNGVMRERNGDDSVPGLVSEIVVQGDTLTIGVGGFGTFRSDDDGVTFSKLNRGLKAIATRQVVVDPEDPDNTYVITWDRTGMYHSTNGGDSFTLIGKNKNILRAALQPGSRRRLYAAGDQFFEAHVTKHGEEWVTHELPSTGSRFVKSMAVSPVNPDRVLIGLSTEVAEGPEGKGLFYTRDRGVTWKKAKGVPKADVTSIVFNPNNSRIVYAAALGEGVYKSTDAGKTFKRIGGDALKYTYRLAISSGDPKVLLAGSNLFFAGLSSADQVSGEYGGLFKTIDGGKTWAEITAGIRDYAPAEDFLLWMYNFGHLPNYEEMLINPTDSDNLIIGHHGESVIITRDNGETWEKQSTGMIPGTMHNYGYCLGTSKKFKRVYACTCGRGLFTGQLMDKVISSVVSDEPQDPDAPRTAAEAYQRIISEVDLHDHAGIER